ncbi:DnaJ domain containing protein [Quillaja saponaria]|uniref:DnaJ domain containing protein n=1 Tax=Quillaja saponaria TaxID=32244 RepID=A0AAD7KT52_QUISA|nr:DnaJ domain containing protein [Quillaja saponaria]
MQIPRWQNFLVLRSSIISSTTISTHVAAFHATPFSFEKWKNKWNSNDVRKGEQPSKSYIKYSTRQKRADAKKALNDLLYNSGASKFPFQDRKTWKIEGIENWYEDEDSHSDSPSKKGHSNSFRRFGKSQNKSKRRRRRLSDDIGDDPETMFQATFGNRWYTWSFNNKQGPSFGNPTSGFEWREDSKWTNRRNKKWDTISDAESDDDSYSVGSISDRTLLGLPATGPLKIEDVKNAFRLSALKWHPDKHQGPSQAIAEEKFKQCSSAYKSLCSVLSPA